MSKRDRLDLFELLGKIDEFDIDYINDLPEEDRVQASSYMLLRWMACSNDRDKKNFTNGGKNLGASRPDQSPPIYLKAIII